MKPLKILFFSYVGWLFFWMTVVFATPVPGSGPVWMMLFPPVALYFVHDNFAFLGLPLLCAALVSVVFAIVINRFSSNFELKTTLTTGWFLVTFLISGELYLDHRIGQALPDPTPECIIEKSFFDALGRQRDALRHSVVVHEGSVYRWSYTQNDFYKSQTALFTVECTPEHKEYWDNIKRSFESDE